METKDKIILYSTHCPRCKVVETKLKQKNIEYSEVDNVDEMLKLGISSAPYLKVGNDLYDFSSAVKWINGVK